MLLAIATLTVGCEEYIDPPFELEESKLVISSNFSPNESVRVRLTSSSPVVGAGRDVNIENAAVSLYEGSELKETLTYAPGEGGLPGVYTSDSFTPQIGIRYTLKANAPGFVPVIASSSIPESADIQLFRVTSPQVITTETGIEEYHFDLIVDYNDPDFADNFYDLRIRQLVTPFFVNRFTEDTIRQDLISKAVETPEDMTNSNTKAGESSYLIADKPAGGIRVSLVSKVNPKTEIPGDLVVELRTVSRDYFAFQTAVQHERRLTSTYFELGVSTGFSNVGGGYGVFAGYNHITIYYPLIDY